MSDEVIYLDVGGMRRRYVLHRPALCAPSRAYPTVIMLDGRGGTPWTAMKTTGWSAFADHTGFLTVYPEATRADPEKPLHFLENPQMWNAGIGGSDVERSPVDDVSFLHAVMDDLAARGVSDPRRIYMTGFSNGASMTFRFAVESGARVAAIGTVAGHFRASNIAPTTPIPLAHFFGQRDPLNPVEGGMIDLPWGKTEWRPAARDSALSWATRAGWSAEESHRETRSAITTERWGAPGDPREVVYTLIHDLGHVWPGGHRLLPEHLVGNMSDRLSATAELWQFFERHTR